MMKKSMFLSLALSLSSITAMADTKVQPGTYQIDPMHTKVGFEIPHLVISSVEGRFDKFEGKLVLGEKISDLKIEAVITTASIDTAIKKRDEHLKSADFFNVEKFPKITFKSKSVSGSADDLSVVGDLTIKGVTKEVELKGKFLGTVKDGYGNTKAAFQASTKINRKDFGLTWQNMVEAGPVVGEEVTISLKVQAAKVESKK